MARKKQSHGSVSGPLTVRLDFTPGINATVCRVFAVKLGQGCPEPRLLAEFWLPIRRGDLAGRAVDSVLDQLLSAAYNAGDVLARAEPRYKRLHVVSPAAPAPPVGGPQGGCTGQQTLPGV